MMTPKGILKLNACLLGARRALQAIMGPEMITMRARAVARAPSAAEEAGFLSQGVAPALGLIGTASGGRFIRQGGSIPVRDAIEQDPVVVTVVGDLVTGRTGQAQLINRRTGFTWRTRKRGIVGPTYPFNQHYLEALENGGVWRVLPRGPWGLEPEPFTYANSMVKTLRPRRIYAGAKRDGTAGFRQRAGRGVRNAVRIEGHR